MHSRPNARAREDDDDSDDDSDDDIGTSAGGDEKEAHAPVTQTPSDLRSIQLRRTSEEMVNIHAASLLKTIEKMGGWKTGDRVKIMKLGAQVRYA